ncbi:MAG: DUF3971 domain-containing protein [Aliishimia sp.]
MPQPAKRSPWRLLRRSLLYFCAIVFFSLTGLLLWLLDRPVEAPDWLQARIEAHIAAQAPDIAIKFGGMVMTVQTGWRPMLELRDVRFENAGGVELLSVSDLQATLAMRPLLDGLVQPRTVSMTGLFATVRRSTDGQVSVVVSANGNSGSLQAATIPELINQLDDLFLIPELAALSSVDVNSVTLRYEDGRARRAWTVDGARLRVQRDQTDLTVSADLALLSGGADVATMAGNFTSPLGAAEAEFGVTVTDVDARDVAAFTPAFGWLDALRAPISGSLRGGVAADGTLTPLNATLQISEGVLQPTGDTRPMPFQSARTYFSFDPSSNQLVFDELSLVSAWGTGRAVGRATLTGIETGRLEQLVGQVQVSAMQVNPPNVYDAPLDLEGAEVDFRLIPHPFQFDLGQMRIVDQGRSLRLEGALKAAPGGWDLALDGRMEGLTPKRLMELWPPRAVPKTRQWLVENLLGGNLKDIDFALRTVPGSKPNSYLSFAFDEASIRYMKHLPPITHGRGVASILRDRFALNLDSGVVETPQTGQVDVSGSSFVIPDVKVKGGVPAEVHIRTSSKATALMAVLDREPLNILSNAGLPIDVVDAVADAQATIKLPLRADLKPQDVLFDVSGDLRELSSTTLVKDTDIRSANLKLVARNIGDDPRVEISGPGTFDGVPFDVVWRQALGAQAAGGSTVSGRMELSADSTKALNIDLPPGTISGTGSGQIDIALPKDGVPQFDLSSNLSGVGLSIPALAVSKARAGTGTLRVSGSLGERPRVDRLELNVAGLSAAGRVDLRADGGLDEARFSRVKVGNWLDAPVSLVGRGAGAAPSVVVRGGQLDMRQAAFGASSGGGSAGGSGGETGPLSLTLDRLQLTDTIALTDMRGDFNLRRGLQGKFSGKVNGQAAVTGEVLPQSGRSAFRIKSSNAGSVFAAAGLLKQARGGDMTLLMNPVGTAGAFNGALTITNTRVKDAPAIAALFNALSVVGLLEQMGGQGLHFSNVEAAFRLTPQRVTLTQASAVGPSIGLSMDGTYDVNTSRMDMQGVFSPIYLINGIGSLLTRKGEGLIGFNFRLTGPASGPRVQVNPLSALTPSIFREIFRRPAPKVQVEPGEEPGATPRVLQTPKRSNRPVAQSGGDR